MPSTKSAVGWDSSQILCIDNKQRSYDDIFQDVKTMIASGLNFLNMSREIIERGPVYVALCASRRSAGQEAKTKSTL